MRLVHSAIFTSVLSLAQFALAAPASIPSTGGIPTLNLPLRPSSVEPGSSAFTLRVSGGYFVRGAVVNWNGAPLPTVYISPTKLDATVPAANLANPATINVTVTNPNPHGGTSSPVFFTITSKTPSLTFAQSTMDVGTSPGAIVAGDFNNDGHTDLAVLNLEQQAHCSVNNDVGTIQILLGNGAGAFAPKSSICLPETIGGAGLPVLMAEDFGNGKLGVAAEWRDFQNDTEITIYRGKGDGTLDYHLDGYGLSDSGQTTIPAFADFNNDGRLDFALVQEDGSIPGLYVFLGNSRGRFSLTGGGPGCYAGSAAYAGDFNGDGLIDLAFLGYEQCSPSDPGPVLVSLGNGEGDFTPTPQIVTSLVSPVAAVVGDFNGDGILDLAFADSGSSALSVLLGNGDGTFTQATGEPDAGQTTQFIATADLNGDGILDLVLIDSSNSILIFLGNGDGTFQNPITVAVGNGASQLAIGDFNNDGRLDLAVVNTADNTVSMLLQAPAAAVSPSRETFGAIPVGGTSNPRRVRIRNAGSAALQIASIVASENFALTGGTCNSVLPAGHTCYVNVVFAPTAPGPLTGTLTITNNTASSPQVIPLTGSGNETTPVRFSTPLRLRSALYS